MLYEDNDITIEEELEIEDEISQQLDEATNNILSLTDEEGHEAQFEFLDVVVLGGKEYVILLPVEDSDDEVVILEVQTEGDETSYTSIEDEVLLESIYDIFKAENIDLYDFED